MEPLTNAQRRAVLSEFLSRMEDGKGLLPDSKPLPYDPVPDIATVAWSIFVAEDMVAGELTELTNQMNHWMSGLRRWHGWNEVLAKHDREVRWMMELEWVEPLAFHCMFQPSATRDRFSMVATNALHQVRMALDPTLKDELRGDPTDPAKSKRNRQRSERETQLKAFANHWSTGNAFVQAHGQIDDEAYKDATLDFRNRASHAIAPRFSFGLTDIVTRTRVQATTLEEQPDKTFNVVQVPGKMSTSYGFGGTPPLSMQETWEANRAQFERARNAFDAYVALLTEATSAMPGRQDPVDA